MKTLNILIPCAGKGSRFIEAGYNLPKPLVPVFKKPMIKWVIDSLNFQDHSDYLVNIKYIFLVLKEHCDKFNIKEEISLLLPNKNVSFIEVDKVTEGAACTSLLAKDLINNDNPLLICNSDQYFTFHKSSFLFEIGFTKYPSQKNIDGIIFTFTSDGNVKWSYAKVNNAGIVEEVAEKRLLDDKNDATVGCYFYKKGSDYVKYAEQMIKKNIRVNNEFYICPIYNEFIKDGKIITIFPVDKMYGLGTPEDIQKFVSSFLYY